MRLIIINFILIFCSALYSQETVLKFDKTEYDFGKMNQNEQVSVMFYYTNVSSQVITIKNVHSSCGCTVPEISKKVLRPNESGEVKVVFNSGRFRGNVQKTVFFEIEPTIGETPRIMIRAKIIPDFYFIPDRIFLPNASKEKIIEEEFKLLSEKFTNFKLTLISYNTQILRLNVKQIKESNSFGYLCKLKIYPGKIEKNYFMEIIKFKTDRSGEELEFAVHGYIR